MIVLVFVSDCGGWFNSKPRKHDSRRFGRGAKHTRNPTAISGHYSPQSSTRATCNSQGLSLRTYKRSISVTRDVPHTDGEKNCALFSRVWLQFTRIENEHLNVHSAGWVCGIQKKTLGRCRLPQ